jgi:hypothetical protein
VTFRRRYLLGAAVGLWMAHPLPGQEPGRLAFERGTEASANQRTADTIAEHLRQSGQLRRYTVNIAFHGGTAELTGAVADEPQREAVLRLVHAVPGVDRVVDGLALTNPGPLTQVQAESGPPALQEPLGPPRKTANGNGGPVEPMPISQAPVPSPYDLNPPKMPPYAWPTYAPYNNFSRVAYPLSYPYQSWPFIGPVYPFPKVPLGWRSVKLQWEDGFWWYGKTATAHDWWRIRYW